MIRISVNGVLFSALVIALVNCSSSLVAAPPAIPVPEMSPAAATSAIAVLASSGLILAERLRFRRK